MILLKLILIGLLHNIVTDAKILAHGFIGVNGLSAEYIRMNRGVNSIKTCSSGIYKLGHCINVQCPNDTVWKNGKCSSLNHSELNVDTNKIQSSIGRSNCCTVITPRMCQTSVNGHRWNCYSRRYKRCGEFCIAPIIFLKSPQPHSTAIGRKNYRLQ